MAAAANIAQQAQAAQAGAGGGPEATGGDAPKAKANDDAVDAEFEEVKDKKKA